MARIRTIKPALWEDEALGACSLAARLLFVGLISHADDEGRQRGAPRLVAANVFPYDEDDDVGIVDLLTELAGRGLIQRYLVRGQHFIQITNWEKHQRVDKRRPSVLPGPECEEMPENTGDSDACVISARGPRAGRAPDKDKEGDKDKEQYRDGGLQGGDDASASSREIDFLRWHAHAWQKPPNGDRWGKRQTDSARWLLASVDNGLLVRVLTWAKAHRFWSGRASNINHVRKEWNALRAQYEASNAPASSNLDEQMRVLREIEQESQDGTPAVV